MGASASFPYHLPAQSAFLQDQGGPSPHRGGGEAPALPQLSGFSRRVELLHLLSVVQGILGVEGERSAGTDLRNPLEHRLCSDRHGLESQFCSLVVTLEKSLQFLEPQFSHL